MCKASKRDVCPREARARLVCPREARVRHHMVQSSYYTNFDGPVLTRPGAIRGF